jgi:DNA-binding CsgD family transcriptional regulator
VLSEEGVGLMGARDDWFVETVAAIYEAAAIPELWPRVLDRLAELTGCMGGILLAAGASRQVRYVASDSLVPLMTAFNDGGWMDHRNTRAARFAARQHAGFVLDTDLYIPGEQDNDPFYVDLLRRYGGGYAAGTMIPAPSGDLLIFNIERAFAEGPVPRRAIATLDLLRPHLARAALLSARLRLEQARSTVEAFGRIGLPAAVLDEGGHAVAANRLLGRLDGAFVFGARERLRIRDTAANRLFADALAMPAPETSNRAVRSIPVPAGQDHPPLVLHLLPVHGAAHDVFGRAAALLIATPVEPRAVPGAEVLQGLFDLTAAEARIARAIGEGGTTRDIAGCFGVSHETVRNQLKAVLAKTGLKRQAELSRLLSGLDFSRGCWA